MREPELVAALRDHIIATAMSPHPQLAMGAAIALLGVIYSHRTRGFTDLRTNFYVALLAASGSGKDYCVKFPQDMLTELGVASDVRNGEPASGQAIVAALHDTSGRGYIEWDEFGDFLKSLNSYGVSQHTQNITLVLKKLYSSANSIHVGKQYADKERKRQDIEQPCLTVLGATTHDKFYNAIKNDAASDGFLARWLVFQEEEDYPPIQTPSEAMFIHMDWLHTILQRQPIGEGVKKPLLARYTGDAQNILTDFFAKIRSDVLRESTCEVKRSIYARCAENAHKLALIAQDRQGIIDESAAMWACGLSRKNSDNLYKIYTEHAHNSRHEENVQSIRNILLKAKKALAQSDLTRKTQKMTPRERQDAIEDLKRMDDIEVLSVSTDTKPKTYYVANKNAK